MINRRNFIKNAALGVFAMNYFDMLGLFPNEKVFAAEKMPDYSQKSSWYQIPEITKDVDTFYILATEYMGFGEGDSKYASMNEPEMVENAPAQYAMNASAFADSTNVFLPFYRQASLKYAGEIWKKNGNIDEAISGIPYNDITAALDYYYSGIKKYQNQATK